MERNPAPTKDRLRRFAAKHMPEPNCGCWLWLGGSNEHGYGVFWNGRRLEKAHRFSYRAFVDPALADDADVCHTCDNPCCVNPEHLFAGTTQDNVDDMWRKKRATVQIRRGTAQSQAKLTDQTAAEIRWLWATGFYKQRDLARDYGVSQSQIWKVVARRGWHKPSGVVLERGRGKC